MVVIGYIRMPKRFCGAHFEHHVFARIVAAAHLDEIYIKQGAIVHIASRRPNLSRSGRTQPISGPGRRQTSAWL